MNNGYQELPPTYTEATEKSDCHPSDNQAVTYIVSCPEHVEYSTLTTTNIASNMINQLKSEPVQCTCMYCHSLITTRISQRPGLLVWLICLTLILFGCWFGFFLIPFCISDLQNTQHFCPNCQKFLGEHRLL